MIQLNVKDEFSPLREVVLGTPRSLGDVPKLEEAYDPKSKEHILKGTYPGEDDIRKEMSAFNEVLVKYGVKVYRPEVINNYNQIFARDIAFVIDDKFVITNMLEDRQREIEALDHVLKDIPDSQILRMPEDAKLEGGDIMPLEGHIFLGYSKKEDFEKYTVARTNEEGLEFVKKTFPNRKVVGFELRKSDTDPRDNALHLDCCFQPLGRGFCILYPGGFKNQDDVEFIRRFFGTDKCIEINREEMYQMNSNVFSISPEVVVSEKGFTRLNSVLRENGFTVEEIPYAETAKMEGLLRCSTLPLVRDNN
ncbi:dimethylarginine dimethylaminohydrolase family protein [Halocola ammonii]